MDPNETLRLIRIMASFCHDSDDEHARSLAELVDSLDGWLSRGGFLPKAWEHK